VPGTLEASDRLVAIAGRVETIWKFGTGDHQS